MRCCACAGNSYVAPSFSGFGARATDPASIVHYVPEKISPHEGCKCQVAGWLPFARASAIAPSWRGRCRCVLPFAWASALAPSRRGRCRCVLPFARASALAPSRRGRCRWCLPLAWAFAFAPSWRGRCRCVVAFCAGIRDSASRRRRCPCAGRHLLFFAAAKKSRQKKAAHTASACVHPRALRVPTLHTAAHRFMFVATVLARVSRASRTRTTAGRVRSSGAHVRQTLCRLSCHTGQRPDRKPTRSDGFPCGANAYTEFAAQGMCHSRACAPGGGRDAGEANGESAGNGRGEYVAM